MSNEDEDKSTTTNEADGKDDDNEESERYLNDILRLKSYCIGNYTFITLIFETTPQATYPLIRRLRSRNVNFRYDTFITFSEFIVEMDFRTPGDLRPFEPMSEH
jgi:hypothetical protein